MDINRGPITPRTPGGGGSGSSTTGTPAPSIYLEDPWVGDDEIMIPGPPGPPGPPGTPGTPGPVILIEAESEETMMIPGPAGTQGLPGLVGPAVMFEPQDPLEDLPMTPPATPSLNANVGGILTLDNQKIGFGYEGGNLVLAGPVAPGADIAPHNMTTDALPVPYRASASTENGAYFAFQAFDGSLANTHNWFATTTTGWLQIDLGAEYILSAYAICAGYVGAMNFARSPRDWTFQGSHDGTTWMILDTRTNQNMWSASALTTLRYTLSGVSGSFRYYRLNITANNGDGSLLGVQEMYLFAGAQIPTFRALVPGDIPYISAYPFFEPSDPPEDLPMFPPGLSVVRALTAVDLPFGPTPFVVESEPAEDLPLIPPWKAPARTLPFFLAAGTSSPITLLDGPTLPFFNTTGSSNNIGITT